MQFINQLLQFLQQGLAAIFRFVQIIWQWSVTQILAVPWAKIGNLPLWKLVLIVVIGCVVLYFLYRAARELLDAGEKALSAFATLLTVFVRTLPPILLAGVAAAVGAWIVNNVNF
jgi:hypothetical protein